MSDAAWRLRYFNTLSSTSDLCRSLAIAGEPEGLAVLADRQTAGRGSRGREWDSPAGNLYLSVLLRPKEHVSRVGQWSLLAGLALAEAIAPHVPDASALTLKWPNDLLLEGRKLAGILLDTLAGQTGAVAWLVIGMGANLVSAPRLPDRTTAAVADVAAAPSAQNLATAVLARLDHWRRTRLLDGFAPIRAKWLEHAAAPGTRLTIRVGEHEVGGSFAGLGDDGSLLLQSGGRVHAFTTGEVLLPCSS